MIFKLDFIFYNPLFVCISKKPLSQEKFTMSNYNKIVIITFCIIFLTTTLYASERGDIGYKPTKSNMEARKWFQDAKFGLFVHWGV